MTARHSVNTSANDISATPARTITTRSSPGGSQLGSCRNTSRTSRLHRLRTTELPTFFDAVMPTREGRADIGSDVAVVVADGVTVMELAVDFVVVAVVGFGARMGCRATINTK
ncbi:MAG: hypothetical protein U0165_00650 [Polyangiaceae bacterium]